MKYIWYSPKKYKYPLCITKKKKTIHALIMTGFKAFLRLKQLSYSPLMMNQVGTAVADIDKGIACKSYTDSNTVTRGPRGPESLT